MQANATSLCSPSRSEPVTLEFPLAIVPRLSTISRAAVGRSSILHPLFSACFSSAAAVSRSSCYDTSVSENPVPSNSTDWPWADSLDALVAAPNHHRLLLEDARVRVLHTRIAAGDIVPLHTHRWGGVAYVESWSHFIRRGEKGEILFDSRLSGEPPKFPCAQRVQPLPPHTVENLGPSEISIVMIEFK